MELSDSDTFKVVIRMFMEFGLIQQFQIPYKVRGERLKKFKIGRQCLSFSIPGPLSMGLECEEELPTCQIPQLAPWSQCLSDHVHGLEDWQDGPFHGRLGDLWPFGSLSLSRLGPQGNKQRFSIENGLTIGHLVQHVHHGAPSLRSVRHDIELRRQ